ncbi:YabP/YqfC family sporulation protein [Alicyclobacillus acidiphilus]|uniref:YabP/YqfC family sporulation protein n=1 Tax=Alicyclobacillus acidiphilus TaxID=182455 RepID=UPI00083227B1|nr:YabP/YqfC family sporulation protein [Alicyclobacillus acidiphilus]
MSHDVRLTDRRELEITGVKRVETFDVNAFELATSEGGLYIEGSALHMKRFDVESGTVLIEGRITSLSYDDEKRRNPLGRLWK